MPKETSPDLEKKGIKKNENKDREVIVPKGWHLEPAIGTESKDEKGNPRLKLVKNVEE